MKMLILEAVNGFMKKKRRLNVFKCYIPEPGEWYTFTNASNEHGIKPSPENLIRSCDRAIINIKYFCNSTG